jgi:anti-sigma-K factor RskA
VTGSDHDHYRDLTAAYVVGALDAHERAEFEMHLRNCDRCRADVVAFAPLPALLGRVDEADLDVGEHTPPDAIVTAVRDDIRRLDRSRRRWRWLASAAAAIVLVLAASVLVGDDDPAVRRGGVELEVQTASSSGAATVIADERPWGTYVHVSAEGLPDRASYALWVVGEDGTWEPAGSWARTPDGAADLGGSSQQHLAEIDRIVVTSLDRADEILVAR